MKKEILYNLDISELAIEPKVVNLLKANNIKNVSDLIEKSDKELLEIPRLGLTKVGDIKFALIAKGLKLKKHIKPKKEFFKTPKEKELALNLVKRFLTWKESEIHWGNELRIAYILLNKEPLVSEIDLPFKINSLAFFLTENGKQQLKQAISKRRAAFILSELSINDKAKNVELSEEKFGEDIVAPIKSIKDFLND